MSMLYLMALHAYISVHLRSCSFWMQMQSILWFIVLCYVKRTVFIENSSWLRFHLCWFQVKYRYVFNAVHCSAIYRRCFSYSLAGNNVKKNRFVHWKCIRLRCGRGKSATVPHNGRIKEKLRNFPFEFLISFFVPYSSAIWIQNGNGNGSNAHRRTASVQWYILYRSLVFASFLFALISLAGSRLNEEPSTLGHTLLRMLGLCRSEAPATISVIKIVEIEKEIK